MAARLVLLLAELTFLLVPSAGQAAQALPASSYAARTEEETLQKLREGARNVKALGIKYDFDYCTIRTPNPPIMKGAEQGLTGELGVVLVVCEEDLAFLEEVGCRGGRLRYYIYSVCGVGRKEITRRAKPVSQCLFKVKFVPSMVYAELSQSVGHAEYLTHIIQNYEMLDERMIFTKAKLAAASIPGMMKLLEAVDLALAGTWAYKSLWPTKMSIAFDRTPEPGNVTRFSRELCTLYRRFTCEAECYSCPDDNRWADISSPRSDRPVDVGRSAYVSPGGCFIASAQRIRSLPVSEYNWLREWLQSWQEEEQGALRKSLADRMWPLMLGCKADLHSNISDAGCTAGMMYESGGTRLKPPDEFIDDGLVHFPPPTFKHENSHPYPHLQSPQYKEDRAITFVVSFGAHIPTNIDQSALLQALVGDILHFHPTALVVILCRSELAVQFRAMINWSWFAGRMVLVEIETEQEVGNFGMMHSKINSDHEVRDWVRVNWMQAFSFELRQQYLMMLANGQIRRADEEDALTHHVFINMNTALLHNVWPVFEGEPFTMAIATRPLPSHPVDSSVLYVHKDQIMQAAELMDSISSKLLLHGGFTGSFDQALHQAALGCLEDQWWLEADARIVSCESPVAGLETKIKLVPAAVWNGIILKGGATASTWLRHEWAASLASDNARVVRLVLHGGGGSLHREMDIVFKTVRERHEHASKLIAVLKDSNTTFIDREARNAVLREAAEHGRMLPGHRTMGHPPIPHRKLQGSPGSMSSNVPEPSLLDTNPEERRFEFDDPMMFYMNEILKPSETSTDKPSEHEADRKGPVFARFIHNRAFTDKLEALYKDKYSQLLSRPSAAGEVAEFWGGSRSAFDGPEEKVAEPVGQASGAGEGPPAAAAADTESEAKAEIRQPTPIQRWVASITARFHAPHVDA